MKKRVPNPSPAYLTGEKIQNPCWMNTLILFIGVHGHHAIKACLQAGFLTVDTANKTVHGSKLRLITL